MDDKGKKPTTLDEFDPVIGIERDPAYFEMACDRLRQIDGQGQLFASPSPQPTQSEMEC